MSRPRGIHIALGLLTFCAVFAAAVGIREALVTRTQALRDSLAATTPLARTITAATTWSGVSGAYATVGGPSAAQAYLSQAQVTQIMSQLRADFGRGPVRMAPAADDWAWMSSGQITPQSPLPAVGGVPVKLVVDYRQPLAGHMRLVAGRFPAAPSSAGLLDVVVTQRTAARFGLRVGSQVRIPAAVTLRVSGIVAPVDADSAFWTADPNLNVPSIQNPFSFTGAFWIGEVIAGPAEASAVQRDFGSGDAGSGPAAPGTLAMQWTLPLALGSPYGQQAQAMRDELDAVSNSSPRLSGDVAPVSPALTVSTGMLTALGSFLSTAQAVDTVLWLVYASLIAAGLTVLLLTARLVALRRSAELAIIRARGASLWHVAVVTGRDAALTCVPAAVAAAVAATVVVPDAGPGSGVAQVTVIVLAVAVGGPAVIAAWQFREPRRRAGLTRAAPLPARLRRLPHGDRAGRRITGRVTAEVTLVAAAVGGIVVFRQQGTPAGAGVNPYASAVPALVAIPAVIVVFRAYPLVLRGLLRMSARARSAAAFLGLAQATRTALSPALPAFALVVALTVAAFAGMVRDAVTSGDVAASWQATGADVTITAAPAAAGFTVTPAAVRAVGAVAGVTHEARVWQATWTTQDDAQVTVLAVDPAGYAALVSATEGFPRVPAGLLAPPARPGAPQPVLASPQAVALLRGGTATLTSLAAVRPVTVRVAGTLSGTNALPGGGAFVIMPFSALTSTATPPQPAPVNEILLTGTRIDRTRLDAVVTRMLPGAVATVRSDVLAGLTGAPLQRGAFTVFAVAIAAAAGLGLAVMLLELALGAAQRGEVLARLATMGLGEGQRARVVALEVLPAVIAAAVAAWACALVLPPVVAPVVNLSVFTGSSAGVPLVPDAPSVGLPLAGLFVLAAVALGLEIRRGRRRAAPALRAGG